MINGTVVNNGSNYGQQTGVSLGSYTALHLPPALVLNGAVFNQGRNYGGQTGAFIR